MNKHESQIANIIYEVDSVLKSIIQSIENESDLATDKSNVSVDIVLRLEASLLRNLQLNDQTLESMYSLTNLKDLRTKIMLRKMSKSSISIKKIPSSFGYANQTSDSKIDKINVSVTENFIIKRNRTDLDLDIINESNKKLKLYKSASKKETSLINQSCVSDSVVNLKNISSCENTKKDPIPSELPNQPNFNKLDRPKRKSKWQAFQYSIWSCYLGVFPFFNCLYL